MGRIGSRVYGLVPNFILKNSQPGSVLRQEKKKWVGYDLEWVCPEDV